MMKKVKEILNHPYLIILVGVLGIYFILNAFNITRAYVKKEIDWNNIRIIGDDKAESLVVYYFWNRYDLINLNGGLRNILGIREMEGVVKLNDGSTSGLTERMDDELIEHNADGMKRLSDYLEKRGIPFYFALSVVSRDKYMDNQFPYGTSDYLNDNCDRMIAALDQREIDYIDFREVFHEMGLKNSEVSFRTDHHWTPIAGFHAFSTIANRLGDGFVDDAYLDLDNYNREIYEGWFVGSSGRTTGKVFIDGGEDFELISSKTYPAEVYSVYDEAYIPYFGEGGCIDPHKLNDIAFKNVEMGNLLTTYSNSSRWYINEDRQGGKSVLIIGDSQSHVVMPYFILSCYASKFIYHNTLYNLSEEFFDVIQPDAVIMMLHPDNIVNQYDFLYYK